MTRGKRQVLFNYLPNRTFDFERIAAIARIVGIRGAPRHDLNAAILIRRIAEEASAWQEQFRPSLRDDIFRQVDRFVLLDPQSVEAELYPKVLWCQEHACGRVFDYRYRDNLPSKCPSCRQGQLIQLRFVKIHRCGSLQPLLPAACPHCHSADHMALDTRGSERISNFRWVCRQCNRAQTPYGGYCTECQWPDATLRVMDIEVHRAGRTYYAHTTVLLNVPHRKWDGFFGLPEWQAVAAAKCLNMPEVAGRPLTDYGRENHDADETQSRGLSGADLDSLLQRQATGQITPEQLVAEMQALRERRHQERLAGSPTGLAERLAERTGVPWPVWQRAGQEMLEAIMPMETGQPTEAPSTSVATQVAHEMGISRLALVSDYPIVTATYGYSRAEDQPNQCRLNPFPAHRDHAGRYPIFVDQIQADALLVSLDPRRIAVWLERNGHQPLIPGGTTPDLALKAYFVQLLSDVSVRNTIGPDQPEARLVFGLLHTLSHLAVRQAALLCGLDRTSLSEYVLPRALTFAIFCNHRFGATIGALTALFEQSLSEWLNAVLETRRCVYDPVCRDRTGNCHACTHLAETSCRFFNLNLSRSFLFGGIDLQLGEIPVGYFDHSLP